MGEDGGFGAGFVRHVRALRVGREDGWADTEMRIG